MINRRELIVGAVAVALVPTRVEAFQLPEDRLISKARIVFGQHIGDRAWVICNALQHVYESEKRYWESLNVSFYYTNPPVIVAWYRQEKNHDWKYIALDYNIGRVLDDDDFRKVNGMNRLLSE